MPPIDHGQYLLDYAFEIGPSKSGNQGPVIIEWVDIKAWVDLNKIELDAWEVLVIREISKAFVAQYYASEGSLVPSPYQPATFDKGITSNRIGGLLRGMMSRKRK